MPAIALLRLLAAAGFVGNTLRLFAAAPGVDTAPGILSGEINGAHYTVAQPARWGGQVLLIAHGLRPETAPLLADLEPDDALNTRLLAEGWIVATTSYRRNGIVVRDAIADLDALRDRIEHDFGPPALVLLMGDSMGGAIVTLMAERAPDRYHGAIAVGAALQVRDAENPLAPSGQPRLPLLFLTNRSELAGPSAYVAAATSAPVPPALWTVDRDGHVNVNQAERALAIANMVAWITAKEIERHRDATAAPTASDEERAIIVGDAVQGRVLRVTDDFGNIFTNYTADDFARIGVRPGDDLLLEAAGRSWRVRYGTDYGEVSRGEWVAFLRAEGVILLAINYGNAAATAGLQPGDPIVVRAVE